MPLVTFDRGNLHIVKAILENGGGGVGNFPNITGGTNSPTYLETTGAFNIVAGATRIKITNEGAVIDGDQSVGATINVNGSNQVLEVGGTYIQTAVMDWDNGVFKTCSVVSGNGNGARLRIEYQS